MVAEARNPAHPELTHTKSPRSQGGANTQSLCIVVDDPDAHRARAIDPEGHDWWFLREVRGPAAR